MRNERKFGVPKQKTATTSIPTSESCIRIFESGAHGWGETRSNRSMEARFIHPVVQENTTRPGALYRRPGMI